MEGLWGDFFLKIIWFLAIQSAQLITNGMFLSLSLVSFHQLFQAPFILFPCHLQDMESEARKPFHSSCVTGQFRKRCSVSSLLFLQRWHQNGLENDIFIRFAPVGTLLLKIGHISSFDLGATLNFHKRFHHDSGAAGLRESNSTKYPILGE